MAGITGERAALAMRDYFLGPRVFRKDPRTHLQDFINASPLAHIGPVAPDFSAAARHQRLPGARQPGAAVRGGAQDQSGRP